MLGYEDSILAKVLKLQRFYADDEQAIQRQDILEGVL